MFFGNKKALANQIYWGTKKVKEIYWGSNPVLKSYYTGGDGFLIVTSNYYEYCVVDVVSYNIENLDLTNGKATLTNINLLIRYYNGVSSEVVDDFMFYFHICEGNSTLTIPNQFFETREGVLEYRIFIDAVNIDGIDKSYLIETSQWAH